MNKELKNDIKILKNSFSKYQKIRKVIENKKAYNKFIELVKNQGGDISYITDTSKFEKSQYIIPVICEKTGYVYEINAKRIGEISGMLGAGRIKKEDKEKRSQDRKSVV